MSTKIYDAYRVPKNIDILGLLRQAKSLVIDKVSGDKGFLHMCHILSVSEAISVSENKSGTEYEVARAERVVESGKKGEFDADWFYHFLSKDSINPSRSLVECKFECSVFYDDDYWYLKFFTNIGWQWSVMTEIEKELNLEDFSYQNKSDPPEDIPYDIYKARDDKWDELTKSSGGNYREGFSFTLFDAFEFKKLVTKNYYTGKELYSHLAYKFDDVIKKKEDE